MSKSCIDCGRGSQHTRCKSCRDRKSYLAHREERLLKAKRYRDCPEVKLRRSRYYHEYRKTHKKDLARNQATYEASSSYRKLYHRLSQRLRDGLRTYTEQGKIQKSSKYGINYKDIIMKLGPCPGEWKEWHIDHIKPLCAFDLNDPLQIQEAFSASNLQWLPARENLIKGGRT